MGKNEILDNERQLDGFIIDIGRIASDSEV